MYRDEDWTRVLNLNLPLTFLLFCLLLFLFSPPTLPVIIFPKVSFFHKTIILLPKILHKYSLNMILMTLFLIVAALRTLIQLTLLFIIKFPLRPALQPNVNFLTVILCYKRILLLYLSKTCRTMQKYSRFTLSIPTNPFFLLASLLILAILFLVMIKSSSSVILPTSR